MRSKFDNPDEVGIIFSAEIVSALSLPLYGNYPGRVLRRYDLMHGDSQHPDWPLDVEDLAKIYIGRFSGVSHRDCVESAKTIRETARKFNINFGSGVSREDSYK